ncbi:citrate/2-methylcitrate synthase [Saccharopolyspora sp. ASAGF58]|uniref:citrate/2-methylcitrate synthase n=1 Tax=Saccharopolyspora sp. ASAGF58 TaxID=2719023 RepID=UPI001FF0BA31|nr:citrate/2-methylcitrate synthase [Saccharopolyspora sp. ASAGF58]
MVNPDSNWLTYRGHPVEDLATRCSFEEVAQLLWHGIAHRRGTRRGRTRSRAAPPCGWRYIRSPGKHARRSAPRQPHAARPCEISHIGRATSGG